MVETSNSGQGPVIPAGWYPDPGGAPLLLRFWDGTAWSDRRVMGAAQKQGSDATLRLDMGLAECATGATRTVTVASAARCKPCQGTGGDISAPPELCAGCGGHGVTTADKAAPPVPCPRCGGTRRFVTARCGHCSGTGRVQAPRIVTFRIPAGVGDGTRLRLTGKGEVGEGGGPCGDLYLDVAVEPHGTFSRKGNDLHVTVSVTSEEAAAGTTVIVTDLYGEPVEVSVARVARSRFTKVVAGRGMPSVRSSARGDLHIHVRIPVPATTGSAGPPQTLEALMIAKTHRVSLPDGATGDGAVAARQLDAALMASGFKMSADLLTALSQRAPDTVVDIAGTSVLPAIWRLVADHVVHNAYFKDFPANVPDTIEFWAECIGDALRNPVSTESVEIQLSEGLINLLTLPTYGRYQHTYEELLAAHDEFVPLATDRLTILDLGDAFESETRRKYLALASSPTPLSADDLDLLRRLSAHHAVGDQPTDIPVRENRAVINQQRVQVGQRPLIDTTTDVLRLACALSDGDVTLQTPTRFRTLSRPHRRILLEALDTVVRESPGKLGDVRPRAEAWKRLGERLHPHEYPHWPHAQQVFAVARDEQRAPSVSARIEAALADNDFAAALTLYKAAPGALFRSVDRMLRRAESQRDRDAVLAAVQDCVGGVSGRVVLSLREHLGNRIGPPSPARWFANRFGRSWVTADMRAGLDGATVEALLATLDAEISRRLPRIEHLVVDADMLDVALPLSDKALPPGFGVLPRGSTTPVDGAALRFFVYWRQTAEITDFDLSVLLTDNDAGPSPTWLSYTRLTDEWGRHSGDIVEAFDGATEFIDLELATIRHRFVVPQINIFGGEGFNEVAESFFGFMLREYEQEGRPFEPRTVRMKSDLRGANRVAVPLVFFRGDDDRWRAKWTHLFLRGHQAYNRLEDNQSQTWQMVQAVLQREYLTVRYLVSLLAPATLTIVQPGDALPTGPEGEMTRLSLDDFQALKEFIST